MDSKKITAKRGLSVILLILVIISSIVLISFLKANQNFDNERLASKRYAGSLAIESQPIITMDIYFDGFGNITGSIIYSNDTLSYEGDYVCIGSNIQFSLITVEIPYQFVFIGNLLTEDSIITGDVQLRNSANDLYNGTFYLSLI
jgi:hypothetical protein